MYKTAMSQCSYILKMLKQGNVNENKQAKYLEQTQELISLVALTDVTLANKMLQIIMSDEAFDKLPNVLRQMYNLFRKKSIEPAFTQCCLDNKGNNYCSTCGRKLK